MSKKFTLALFMLPLLALTSLQLFAQKSLQFVGGTSRASASAGIVPGIGTDATIELWVYVPVAEAGEHHFISQGGATLGLDDFFIGYTNGGVTNDLTVGPLFTPTDGLSASLPIGQWNHIAVVADNQNGDVTVYLNGVVVGSTTGGGNYYTTNAGMTGSPLQLGTDVGGALAFNGMVDNVRIWQGQRTAAQVKAGMYGNVSASDPNLLAWYRADEASGTNVANSTATTGLDLTATSDVIHASGPAIGNNNALTFDNAVSTQVDIPANANYDFGTGTIEADVQPNGLSGNAAFVANRGGGGSRWSIHMNNTFGNNLIVLYNSTQGQGLSAQYAPGFVNGNWYHVSLVTAPGPTVDTTAVYIDGIYLSQITNAGTPVAYGGVTGQHLTIGANGVDGSENWTGGIDEVRLWNTALTGPQIQANLGTRLTGTETNLVGLWSFDQGINDGDNAGLKVAVDNTSTTNNGILNNNFGLQPATTSNFVTHLLVPLPVTFGKFTVTKQGPVAQLSWQTYSESNTKDFTIERSGNGVTYTDIGSVAAAGFSNTVKNYAFTDNDPLEGNNYYRILERDLDLKPSYSEVRALAFTKTGNLIWYSTGAKAVEIRLQKGSTELYTITDASGQPIRKGRLSAGTTTLTGVASGIYFVKVINAAGVELNTKVLLP